VSEQGAEVGSNPGAEAGPFCDTAGQIGVDHYRSRHQKWDEAQGERGGELQGAVDEVEGLELPPDSAGRAGVEVPAPSSEDSVEPSPGRP
jgi:hypothetical protein